MSQVELMQERPSVQALAAVTKVEIDTQISTAKAYPRDMAKIHKDVLAIIQSDQEIAAACFYSLPRGDKVKGPSVRLAEIYVTLWTNLRVQVRVVEDTGTQIRCEAVVFDLEKNTSYRGEATRRLTTKDGRRYSEDVVIQATNACGAIAYRNAVFKIVPGVLVSQAYRLAQDVAIGDISTVQERAGKSIVAFGKMGVTREMIFEFIGVDDTAQFTLQHVEELIGVYNAIKEGAAIEAYFKPKPKEKEKPKGKKPQTLSDVTAAMAETAPEPEPAPPVEFPAADDADLFKTERQPGEDDE
jgi:hypothetical protein